MARGSPFAVPPPRRLPIVAAATLLGLGLGALVLAGSILESWFQHRMLTALMEAEGGALTEAVGHAVEHALRAGSEIEEVQSERLLDQARLLDRLESARPMDRETLTALASDLGLSRIVFFDERLRPAVQVNRGEGAPDDTGRYGSFLSPFLEKQADEWVLPHKGGAGDRESHLAAAVRRERGGAVLVEADAAELLTFEEQVGAGNLMEAVAGTGGIEIATLEDSEGNVLAQAVNPLTGGRAGKLSKERPVDLGHGRTGRLRVVLSTEALSAADRAGRRRTAVAGLLVFGLALAAGAALLARQRVRAQRSEVAQVRSVTDAVLDGMEDAVVVVDSGGIVRLVNPAAEKLLGRSASKLVGSPCGDSPCGIFFRDLAAPGETREMDLPRPEGGTVPVLVGCSPVREPDGRVVGTAILARDLTEIRRLERETRRTESLAAFARLAATVAHEVRNPLNAIAVGAQRLEREYLPPGEAGEGRRLVGILRSEIARLDGIVARFLDLARPPRLNTRPGALQDLIREMAPLLATSATDSVRVVDETAALPPVLFDAEAIRQIVFNLVRNAVEAVGDRGTVRLSTRAEGRWAVLEIRDDGPGIAPGDRDHVFEFGFTTRPGGNGLGLPVVHRLVTEMGGSVTLESPPEGGTVARVRLPLAPDMPS